MTIQCNVFEFKFGKNIEFFEFRLTKMQNLLFDLIAFFLLTRCFLISTKKTTFPSLSSNCSKYGFVVFYREFTKLAADESFFVLVASAVATVGPGTPYPSNDCLSPPPVRFTQNAF